MAYARIKTADLLTRKEIEKETVNIIQNGLNSFKRRIKIMSATDELVKLKQLLDDGVLTQEEFDKQKEIVLKRMEKNEENSAISPVNSITPNNYNGNRFVNADVRFRQEKSKIHTLGVLSMIFGFLSPPVAWILAGVGISRANQLLIEFPGRHEIEGEKALCKVGLICSIFMSFVGLISGIGLALAMN